MHVRYAGPRNSYGKNEQMLPETRRMVQQFYKPFNERLAKLLGDPYFVLWNQTAAS
jgi:N-acetylgalactosamine 4-sulfate 6-O-sulfotransferase